MVGLIQKLQRYEKDFDNSIKFYVRGIIRIL